MADSKQDRPDQKKLRSRFNRTFGTGEAKGYAGIYAEEWRDKMRHTDGSDVMLYTMMSTMIGAAAGLCGAMGGLAIEETMPQAAAALDAAVSYGYEQGYRYHALSHEGKTYALFSQDGEYRLYVYDGDELDFVDNAGAALESSFDISEHLQALVTSLEQGTRPEGAEMPNFYAFTDISERYKDWTGGIERDVEQRQAADLGGQPYLHHLRAALQEWNAAKSQLINGQYGFSAAQTEGLNTQKKRGELVWNAALATGVAGFGLFLLAPFGMTAGATIARAHRSRRRLNQDLKNSR